MGRLGHSRTCESESEMSFCPGLLSSWFEETGSGSANAFASGISGLLLLLLLVCLLVCLLLPAAAVAGGTSSRSDSVGCVTPPTQAH